MRDRLIETIQQAKENEFIDLLYTDITAIADYLLANGVVVPPCKVGQTVYYISFGKVYKGKCHAITQHKDSLQIHLYDYDGDNASISADRVFLTKEEAEKALATDTNVGGRKERVGND